MPTNDHREPIAAALYSYTERTVTPPEGVEPDEWHWTDEVLDCDVLRSAKTGRTIVEITLAVGGPTVWIEVDSRFESVTFHHSWGKVHDGADAEDLTTLVVAEGSTPWETWTQCAAELAEITEAQ